MINHRRLVLVAHDVRSSHNVGSLLRTADGLGVNAVLLTGHTPHPEYLGDDRLPHLAAKQSRQIQKTALGAEATVSWRYNQDITGVIRELIDDSYTICALEQATGSIKLPSYHGRGDVALIVGNEVEGLPADLIAQCSTVLEIPMLGSKESFNIAQAAAMALYHLRFIK